MVSQLSGTAVKQQERVDHPICSIKRRVWAANAKLGDRLCLFISTE